MNKPFRGKRQWMLWALVVTNLVLACILVLQFLWRHPVPKAYGFTWSSAYAEYLGIHPVYGLQTALRELSPQIVRLPIYWNQVQPTSNALNWKIVDDMVRALSASKTDTILVVGVKQPRWPECWIPEWAKTLSPKAFDEARERYVKAVVKRYDHVATVWQIENEPTFFTTFGDCSSYKTSWLSEEIGWVQSERETLRATTTKPLITTMSGEISMWRTPDTRLSALGVSLYRVISTTRIKRWSYWFIRPWAYDLKAWALSRIQHQSIFVSEFQMEPWLSTDVRTTSLDEQFVTFDLTQMRRNFDYAERLRRDPIVFWGVEWWLWMKEHKQHPEFWEMARLFFQAHR